MTAHAQEYDGHGHGHGHEIWPDDPAHPLWERDQIVLTSVGIDIGSATSQFLFSRLVLRRMGRELSSAFAVVSKEVLFESPVWLTPYAEGLTIDETRLRRLVDEAFTRAGTDPGKIDTGAVILTGEAARRRNARAIAEIFAAESGRFVCATAGHHLEARMAAYGSGATALAEVAPRVLNIDIGGGTTKLTIVEEGEIVWTGALHVGGRLVQLGPDGAVARLEPAAEKFARLTGHELALGKRPAPDAFTAMAELMANAVLDVVTGRPRAPELEWILLTGPVPDLGRFDGIVYSGGVSEYVMGRERDEHDDIGPYLGQALKAREHLLPGPVRESTRGIRATVMGASQFTVQVSGNTIHISDESLLPLRNLRVVVPPLTLGEKVDADQVTAEIEAHLSATGIEPGTPVAFGFRWDGVPRFDRLDAFVEGVRRGTASHLGHGEPLILLIQGDIARTVGGILHDQGRRGPVLVVDGIAVTDFDFVDLGSVLAKSGVVPVTLKSLVFSL